MATPAPYTCEELQALRDVVTAVHLWRKRFAAHHGLTVYDTLVLTALADAPGGVPAATLARAVDITSGRLTGTIDRLEAAGLAHRQPNLEDRRSVCVALTEEGQAMAACLDHALLPAGDAVDDPHFREEYVTRLQRLRAAVDEARHALRPVSAGARADD
jgi:DNA-binding MarR family transcriptional regulator